MLCFCRYQDSSKLGARFDTVPFSSSKNAGVRLSFSMTVASLRSSLALLKSSTASLCAFCALVMLLSYVSRRGWYSVVALSMYAVRALLYASISDWRPVASA